MDTARAKRVAIYAVCVCIGFAAVAGASAVGGGILASLNTDDTVTVDGTLPLNSPNNNTIYVEGANWQQLLTDPFTLSGTVNVITTEGNVTFYSAGDTAARIQVDEIEGPWTNVTGISADPNTLQIDPGDKSQVTVGQEIKSFNYTGSFGVDDGSVDFVYSGTTGQSEVTFSGVTADQQIVAVDASTGDYLDVATSDSNGAVTFDALTNSEHAVLLQTATLEDPVLENPSPTGGQSTEPSELSIDVSDAEFGNGDTVDVTFWLNGNQIHTETITADQTVTTSIPSSGKTAGSHDWTVEADPDYGSTVTESYEYSIPETVYVREELNHSELIDSPISIDGTFFGDDEIFSRTGITDGTIDMTGLPVAQSYIVEVEPDNSNYTTRSLYVDSIFQQQDIYLLNTSAVDTVESRFVLDDPTGQYGPTSIVFIQRPMNISGSTQWKTVHSDGFGAEGVTATLEKGQRYRIRVQNSEGDEQLIGPYRADVSETVTVQPGTPTIEVGEFEDGWGANAVLTNRTLEYRYSDPSGETDQVTVWIHEKGDTSNRLQANESYFNLGNFSAQTTLTENQSKKTWVVNFIVDRNGDDFAKKIEVSNKANILPGLPNPWNVISAVALLLMTAGTFSVLNARDGGVVIALVGGMLWWFGLLDGATTGIGVALGLFVAVSYRILAGSGP